MSLHALAQDMSSKGRFGDSMLVHMSPNEVAGLHALALAHGEKLTINPETGLPEAFKLKSLLPAILGFALAPATGGASLGLTKMWHTAALVGAGFGLAKGSLKEGLLAGLGAYGGAGLASSLASAGVSEAAAQEAFKQQTSNAALEGASAAENFLSTPSAQATGTGSTTTLADATGAASPVADVVIDPVRTYTPPPGIEPGSLSTANYVPPTGLEALSQGAQSIYDKGTFGQFAKANKNALYSVGASALLSPENEEDAPTEARRDGYIRPARYDWRTGKYEYFEPVKASEWGTRNLSEYTSASDPRARTPIGAKAGGLMALAGGGAIAFAEGGAPQFTVGEGASPDRTEPREPLNSMGLPVTPRPGEPGSPEARAAAYEKQMAELAARKAARAAAGEPNYNRFTVTGFGPNGVTHYDTTDPTYTGPGTGVGSGGGGNASFTTGGGSGAGTPVSQRSATSPYITPEAPNTTGAAGARNMDAGWASYFDTSKPGDVWSFAGGTLTRNANGSTTFVGPDGRQTTFNRNTSYAEVARNAPSIAAKWAEDYGYTPSSGGTTPGPTNPPPYTPPPGPYNPPPPMPTTPDIKDVTTGGSLAAYEYLLDQGAYPTNPYLPINPSTGTRDVAKPIYETPGYEALKPKPSASLYSTNPNIKPTGNPGTGNEWVWENDSGIRSMYSRKGKWVAKPVSSTTPAPEPTPTNSDSNGQANGGMVRRMALGGLGSLAGGGSASQYNLGGYSDGGRLLRGPGDGVSDSIPATIGRRQPARLADGEFVVPARIVSELGNGSTEAGARKLYAMMDRVQRARGKTTGKKRVAVNSRADKYLPA